MTNFLCVCPQLWNDERTRYKCAVLVTAEDPEAARIAFREKLTGAGFTSEEIDQLEIERIHEWNHRERKNDL